MASIILVGITGTVDAAAPPSVSPAVTSGTPRVAAGTTTFVRDIDPTGGSNPLHLTRFGSRVVFSARDDAHGRELWITTDSSASRLRDIAPGSMGSSPQGMTVVGSTLYFSADDHVHGRELWKTDGTTSGTKLVRDIRPGAHGSSPRGLDGLSPQGVLHRLGWRARPERLEERRHLAGYGLGRRHRAVGISGRPACRVRWPAPVRRRRTVVGAVVDRRHPRRDTPVVRGPSQHHHRDGDPGLLRGRSDRGSRHAARPVGERRHQGRHLRGRGLGLRPSVPRGVRHPRLVRGVRVGRIAAVPVGGDHRHDRTRGARGHGGRRRAADGVGGQAVPVAGRGARHQ